MNRAAWDEYNEHRRRIESGETTEAEAAEAARRYNAHLRRLERGAMAQSESDRVREREAEEARAELHARNQAKLFEWKLNRLMAVGFTEALATLLIDWRVDTVGAVRMVERGCDPILAAQILEPVDA